MYIYIYTHTSDAYPTALSFENPKSNAKHTKIQFENPKNTNKYTKTCTNIYIHVNTSVKS